MTVVFRSEKPLAGFVTCQTELTMILLVSSMQEMLYKRTLKFILPILYISSSNVSIAKIGQIAYLGQNITFIRQKCGIYIGLAACQVI